MNQVLNLLELDVEIREFISHLDEMKNAKEMADNLTFLKWFYTGITVLPKWLSFR
ncbi:MAG: hypothetical protein HOE48_17780 [Candidatus Latescibacteria bacterium]|jgi:hypothetical protein|nr:hypothetical protein [Candidatus Latescibacterota bacterium]